MGKLIRRSDDEGVERVARRKAPRSGLLLVAFGVVEGLERDGDRGGGGGMVRSGTTLCVSLEAGWSSVMKVTKVPLRSISPSASSSTAA